VDADALMSGYFSTMAAGGDLGLFLAADVTWSNVETAEVIFGADAVRAYIEDLHRTLYAAHAEGTELTVFGAPGDDRHACLEGAFVAEDDSTRIPFCLVYDLGADTIAAMRLYTSFAALAPLAR